MNISLIRHGKSTHTEKKVISHKHVAAWIRAYDDNGVFPEPSYPSAARRKVKESNIILTSDLKRAVESARLLQPHLTPAALPIFREAELPLPPAILRGLSLPPGIWVTMLRCLWLCGYRNECESLQEAKQRARKAAKLLVRYANEQHSVVLVGHGIFNTFISQELRRMGWSGEKAGTKHWSCTTYSYV